ncbi:ATP-binding cassette domain-containing protein [Mariniluteicoccus flavus]
MSTISITGARAHNLADVDLEITKGALTVVTGVSGSGKSSLVFDTIASEAMRQLYETLPAFVRGFLPSYARPDVDAIENLPATIVVDQSRLGGGARSTVGTITDIAPLLRLLFSRAGTPHVGSSDAFSFNLPSGMCPDCTGLGEIVDVDLAARTQAMVDRFTTTVPCPTCRGARLNRAALDCRIEGWNIADLSAMESRELLSLLRLWHLEAAQPVVDSLIARLGDLDEIGLGYLSLDRRTATLSGGESQRVKVVKHLASSLVDLLYVFDEPSTGLHARDVDRMVALLRSLRDKGNTVLVVEHDRDVILAADHAIDIGPGAGAEGGRVVFDGPVSRLRSADTATGRHLDRRPAIRADFREPQSWLGIGDATVHNLQHVDTRIPVGVLTAVTGVAGSGKSSLIHGVFCRDHPDAIVVDQSAPTTNRRSSVATYTGALDPIRQVFAKANGVRPSLFSANSEGACPECQGQGVVYTDLAFLEGFTSPCTACRGRRFTDAVLAHRWRRRSISDVLETTVGEALDLFAGGDQTAATRSITRILSSVVDVGLDYLHLGQPLPTLSGGECQRIKLASHLHREGAVYVLDEPTTGLHMSDVDRLLGVLDHLVDDRGATVVVIEHDLDVIAHADWVIDLGPDGGAAGGRLLFEGNPRDLLSCRGSHTADFLGWALRSD